MNYMNRSSSLFGVTRSTGYRFTLPVRGGVPVDLGRKLAALRRDVAEHNRDARDLGVLPRHQRLTISVKYRGPRFGNRYNSPRATAVACDVYVYRKTDWNRHPQGIGAYD